MTAIVLFWFSVFLMGYTLVVYPAIVTLLAYCKRRQLPQQTPEAKLPTVTLAIAAYNEEDVIARKLDNTLSLNYPPDKLQIIVAADGSDDKTVPIVESYKAQNVELAFQPGRAGKVAAVNRAIQSFARGEIIVFSDANNLFDENALRELVKYFQDASVGVVSGAKHIYQDSLLARSEGLYWRYESFIKKKEAEFYSCTGLVGEIMAVRRELYTTPPDWVINDDFFIAMLIARKDYRIAYAPEAHSFERTLNDPHTEIIRRARIVAGRYQAMLHAGRFLRLKKPVFCWQVVSHKFIRALLPFALVVALLSNCWLVVAPLKVDGLAAEILYLSPPWNWLLLGGQLVCYGAALGGGRLKKFGIVGKLLYVAGFFIRSNYASLLGLLIFVMGKHTVLWSKASRTQHKGDT